MKKAKKIALGTLAGGMLLGGTCLGGVPWRSIFWDAALYTGDEYLFDNDTSPLNIDRFEDGAAAGGAG